jgi:hypothetical protein
MHPNERHLGQTLTKIQDRLLKKTRICRLLPLHTIRPQSITSFFPCRAWRGLEPVPLHTPSTGTYKPMLGQRLGRRTTLSAALLCAAVGFCLVVAWGASAAGWRTNRNIGSSLFFTRPLPPAHKDAPGQGAPAADSGQDRPAQDPRGAEE